MFAGCATLASARHALRPGMPTLLIGLTDFAHVRSPIEQSTHSSRNSAFTTPLAALRLNGFSSIGSRVSRRKSADRAALPVMKMTRGGSSPWRFRMAAYRLGPSSPRHLKVGEDRVVVMLV